MKNTKISLILMASILIMSLLLFGCSDDRSDTISASGTTKSTSQVLTAREIAERLISTYPELTSFKTSATIDISMERTGDDQAGKMALLLNMDGSINTSDKEMVMDIVTNMDINLMSIQNMMTKIYMIDGWTYYGVNIYGEDERWVKTDNSDITELFLNQQNKLTSQLDLIKYATTINLSGSEILDGIECYVLHIEPDINYLFDWMKEQTQLEFNEEEGTDNNFECKYLLFNIWVAKDTFRPVKQVLNANLEISDPDTVSSNQQNITINMELVAKFSDYGVPFLVQIPYNALNAEEASLDILNYINN